MPKLYDEETHLPIFDDDRPLPPEEKIPKEDIVPREEVYSFDEYNLNVAPSSEREERQRSRLKDMFLKPLISMVAIVGVVLASYGIDPFGNDALNKDKTVMAAQSDAGSEAPADADDKSDTADTDETSVDTTEDTTDETEEETLPPEDEDEDVFPELGNLDPDFAGDYAWSGDGSEEYIRFARDGDTEAQYLVKGGAWVSTYDPAGPLVTDPTAVYDEATNTLTLNGFSASMLDVNLMGNGFTIKLEGHNEIGSISIWGAMYGGSLKIVGDGSLTVSDGIVLNCENSGSCFMVGRGVTLDISGENGALFVYDTTLEQGIYLSDKLTLSGGEIVSAEGDEYEGKTLRGFTVLDADGNPSTHVRIEPKA